MEQTDNSNASSSKQRRPLLLTLAALLLIILCVILCVILWPIINRPGLAADAGGPYTIGEGQPLVFDGNGSTGGNIVTYAWDFGDGNVGDGASPTHTYDDGPAEFMASLTITDNKGQTSSNTTMVTVNNLPPSAQAGGPYTCSTGQTIHLTGVCDDPGPLDAASLSCLWGYASAAAVINQLDFTCPSEPGEITLDLTATDKDGDSGQGSTIVNVTEAAEGEGVGSGDATVGDGDTATDGDNSGDGDAATDGDSAGDGDAATDGDSSGDGDAATDGDSSGDGDAATDGDSSGDGDAATDGDSSGDGDAATDGDSSGDGDAATDGDSSGDGDEATGDTEQAADNLPPTASIEIFLRSKNGLIFGFSGSQSADPDGEIVAYKWDFGDGKTGTGVEIVHTYTATGTYIVNLTVTDDKGQNGAAAVNIP